MARPVTAPSLEHPDAAAPKSSDDAHVADVTEDLERVAAEIDLIYRSKKAADPIALHDALHALHRAIVSLGDATAELLALPPHNHMTPRTETTQPDMGSTRAWRPPD